MTAERTDTIRLQRLARAYCETAVLFAAIDLDLFTHVAQGADSVEKLASAMGIRLLQAERLVTAAVAMGLLSQSAQGLRNAADAERFLVKGKPGYAADWLMFTRDDVPAWFSLTNTLREAEAPSVLGMYENLTVEQARKYHAATYSVGAGAGRRFARQVDMSARRRLLDLGGGSGAYSIEAVKANPQLRAVVFDLPPVIEVAREYIAAAGVGDRVDVLPGDFARTAFPKDVDIVVMASNLPIYDEAVIGAVIARVNDALLPGGEFHLVGEMLRDDRSGPLDAALWGMNEAVCRSAGKAHTISQCVGYFRAAGFVDIGDEAFISGTLHRVHGRKPG